MAEDIAFLKNATDLFRGFTSINDMTYYEYIKKKYPDCVIEDDPVPIGCVGSYVFDAATFKDGRCKRKHGLGCEECYSEEIPYGSQDACTREPIYDEKILRPCKFCHNFPTTYEGVSGGLRVTHICTAVDKNIFHINLIGYDEEESIKYWNDMCGG